MTRVFPFLGHLFSATGVAADSLVRTMFGDYALIALIPAVIALAVGLLYFRRK